MTKYEELKQKIVEPVGEYGGELYYSSRPITLENVLRAIELRKPTIKITDTENINYGDVVDITEEEKTKIMLAWTLGKPLSEQREETINLLHGIIVK